MYHLRHHDFFKVFLPKNRDPEKMDFNDMFLEETALYYGDQITTNYKLDDDGRTIFDIDILPSYIYTSWYFNQNDPNAQFRNLNSTIDRLFIKKMLSINPLYRSSGFLDYHFHYYTGEKSIFFTYLRYEIIPLREKIIKELEEDKDFTGKIPSNNSVKEIIQEWIELNNKKVVKANLFSLIKSLNWGLILGIVIAFLSLLTDWFFGWDIIKNFINSFK
jgi:hypothetical protein